MHLRMTQLLAACLFLATWLRGAAAHAADALLVYDANVAPVAFAAAELDAALRARGYATQHRSFEREPERPAQAQRAAPAAPSLRVRFVTRERALRREAAGTATAQALRGMRAEGFTLLQTGDTISGSACAISEGPAGQVA